jgi:hypothetical protein
MKKLILGFTAFCALSMTTAKAQSGIEIRLDGVGANLAGTTNYVNLTTSSSELSNLGNGTGLFEVHFDITNNTGADAQWRITRKKMSVPTTWVDQVCWPPQCYNANGDIYVTPNSGGNPAPTVVNGTAMTTNSEVAEMKPRITIDLAAASSALYRYYVTDASTGAYLDSIDLNINFALAVNPIKQNPTISLSPNPATDNVTVQLGSAETGSVRIVDALGNVVYNEMIANGTKSIDVSNFKTGVYFVIIDPSDAKPVNRKLIVKH